MTFTTSSTPVAVRLRHYTKTGEVGTRCVQCAQRIPPGSEHECWTLEEVKQPPFDDKHPSQEAP